MHSGEEHVSGYSKSAAITKIQTNSNCLNQFPRVIEHEQSNGTIVIHKAAGFFYLLLNGWNLLGCILDDKGENEKNIQKTQSSLLKAKPRGFMSLTPTSQNLITQSMLATREAGDNVDFSWEAVGSS